jgi:hypothetical protein
MRERYPFPVEGTIEALAQIEPAKHPDAPPGKKLNLLWNIIPGFPVSCSEGKRGMLPP